MTKIYLILLSLLASCATHTIKTTEYTPVVQGTGNIIESMLLDIGVTIMDAGLDDLQSRDGEVVSSDIRLAEARYATYLLSNTLQRSGNWGIVYLLPNDRVIMDVYIDGIILRSNGEEMLIQVTVRDSTGITWYTTLYKEIISQFSYEPSELRVHDPFQVIYNNIVNDLLEFRDDNISTSEISNIRAISEMQFARSFAPDAFEEHLYQDKDGVYKLNSLPSETDPLLSSVRIIRERDYMFVDTIQDYYENYTRLMRNPYDSWRELAYDETIEIRELQTSALRRKVIGGALVLGGIAGAVNAGSYVGQTAGVVAIGAGATLVKEGFNKSTEAEFREETLRELNESFANDVAPKTIAIENRTVILSGNIEEQYKQWREILANMYNEETQLIQ